jgi:hypothetical protein
MSQSQWRKRKVVKRQESQAWLPIALIGGGVLLLAAVVLFAFRGGITAGKKVPVEVNGAPRLKVDQREVNLGDVPLGRTVQVAFKIANVGDQTLWFTDNPYIEVKEGC